MPVKTFSSAGFSCTICSSIWNMTFSFLLRFYSSISLHLNSYFWISKHKQSTLNFLPGEISWFFIAVCIVFHAWPSHLLFTINMTWDIIIFSRFWHCRLQIRSFFRFFRSIDFVNVSGKLLVRRFTCIGQRDMSGFPPLHICCHLLSFCQYTDLLLWLTCLSNTRPASNWPILSVKVDRWPFITCPSLLQEWFDSVFLSSLNYSCKTFLSETLFKFFRALSTTCVPVILSDSAKKFAPAVFLLPLRLHSQYPDLYVQ